MQLQGVLLPDFWKFTYNLIFNLDISSGLGAPISEAELRIDLI